VSVTLSRREGDVVGLLAELKGGCFGAALS
jgi:hypothetical protein